ncbi:hypothetical protein [Streptomyces sp. NPDC007929]|uniref:hypothetical protein n=1 Tax=unclassified Streptomyces TaxID=2593676 RepID=UPI0036EF07BC
MRKMITLRSAVIMGAAVAAGVATGGAVEAVAGIEEAGPVVTGAVALWFAEKLDRIIGEDGGEEPRA